MKVENEPINDENPENIQVHYQTYFTTENGDLLRSFYSTEIILSRSNYNNKNSLSFLQNVIDGYL